MTTLVRKASYRFREGVTLRELADDDLVRIIRSDTASRKVLLGYGYRKLSLTQILDAGKHIELAHWISALIRDRNDDAGERSEALDNILSLSRVTAGTARLCTALVVVADVAGSLRRAHADNILRYCLDLASQANDPYDRSPLPGRARSTAVAILQEHPALDSVVFGYTIQTGAPAMELLAAALKGRPQNRPKAVAAAIEAVKPTRPFALKFAESCDARSDLRSLEDEQRSRSHHIGRAADFLQLVRSLFFVALLLIPVGVGLAAEHFQFEPLPFRVDLASALAALAVLVAAHVVAAQLAADRLPGPIARHTSMPDALIGGYEAAATLAFIAATEGEHPGVSWTWASAAVLGELVICVFVSLRQLLERTDSAAAAEAFVRSRQRFAWQAGTHIGQIQLAARAAQERLGDLNYVRLRTMPARTERRVEVRNRKRGVFLVRVDRVANLGNRSDWGSGRLRLYVRSSIGTIADKGEVLVAAVPEPDYQVTGRELRRAARVIKIVPSTSLEAVAEACSALVSIAARLGRQGDQGGAERSSRAVVDILEAHLQAAHNELEGSARDLELAPVTPALRTSIHLAVTGLRDASTSVERELFSKLIERLLGLSKPADGLVMMTVTALQQLNTSESAMVASRALKAAGLRALENGDRLGLREVWEEFRRRLYSPEGHLNQMVAQDAAEIAATACWLDYSRTRYCWRHFWQITEPPNGSPTDRSRFLLAAEIGSAALAAGVISVAVQVALALRDSGIKFDALRTQLQDAELKARFAAWSEWGGGFLSQQPEGAVAEFMEFASTVADSVPD